VGIARRDFIAVLAGAVLAPGQSASPRIKVGCQTRAYGVPIADREKLLSVLDDLVATGYQGFETNYASLQSSFEEPASMRAEFEKRQIKLIGLHGSANFTNPDNVEKERTQIDRLAKASKGLGAELLILSSAGVARNPDGRLDSAALKLRCIELNRAGAACRALGIRLCTHNHAKEVANDGEEVNAVMARTKPDDVAMLMDAAYVHGAGLSVPAFIRKHHRRIAGIHVRDMREGKEVDMGTGELDFRGIADALRETRWAGWVILEINKRADISSRQLVESSRKYMRDVMKI
jgi:sugar phosphate isomerase/epimerase